MKKKLLVLLLIAALSIFVFAGCEGLFPGEGEGEGEGEPEKVVVEIEDAVKINGIDYVAKGEKEITVTFPAPVSGLVSVEVSSCTSTVASTEFLYSNADKTVWTGSVNFDCKSSSVNPCGDGNPCGDTPCCKAIITVKSGACEVDNCTVIPVVVDCEPPAIPDFKFACDDCNPCDECVQEGIYFTFKSLTGGSPCDDPEDTCYDDCSGVAEWKFTVGDKCDECVLAEGTGCPIEGKTLCGCLPYKTAIEVLLDNGNPEKEYEINFEIKDKVGNTNSAKYYIVVNTSEVVECMVDYLP